MANNIFTATNVGIRQINRLSPDLPDIASGNSAAIEAWLAAIPAFESAILLFDASSDTVVYPFARTIVLQQMVTLRGGGPGGRGAYASYLTFPQDTTGIHIKSFNPNHEASPPNWRGDNVLLEDLTIVGRGPLVNATTGHGVFMQAHARLRNLYITNFGGNGVSIEASVGDAPPTNANLWMMERVASGSNKGHGFYINGSDANAGIAILCDASSNKGWGFYDSSFLGNTYVTCHTDANLLGSYKAEDANARCMFLGCYHEGGQNLPDMGESKSTWLGGLVEGRIKGGSFVTQDRFSDGLSFRMAGQNQYSNSQVVTLGSTSQQSLQAALTVSTVEDGSFPQLILHFDRNVRKHEFVWYSTAGSEDDGIKIASVNSENNARAVPPGMWTFRNGHFIGTQRFDSGSTVPSTAARLWRTGDIRWNSGATAGDPAGWVCVKTGMTGSYTEGFTATADGSSIITLNAVTSILKVGDLINCNGTVDATITQVGEFASGSITCESVQPGDKVTVMDIVFTAVRGVALTNTTFDCGGNDDIATAASLANQITNHKDSFELTDLYHSVTATAMATDINTGRPRLTNVVTVTAKAKGITGNTYTFITNDNTRLAWIGRGVLAHIDVDAAYASGSITCVGVGAGDTVTVMNVIFVAVTDPDPVILGQATFDRDGGDIATAASLAEQINNHFGLFSSVKATALWNVVTVTAKTKNRPGINYTFDSNDPIALKRIGGGVLANRITNPPDFASGTVTCAQVQANDAVTVMNVVFKAETNIALVTTGKANFYCGSNIGATADSLAEQINNHPDVSGHVTATATDAANPNVVTVTANTSGSGDRYTFLTSDDTRLAWTGRKVLADRKVDAALATGSITCATVGAGDTVTVMGVVFTPVSGDATPGQSTFTIDGDDTVTAASLALQINNYPNMNLSVTATALLNIVIVTAKDRGVPGHTYTFASNNTGTLARIGGGVLANGDDGTKITLNANVSPGSDLAISYSTATRFSEFGHCNGGIPDATGTPGVANQNSRRGRVAIAANATNIIVTNSRVTESSIIHATLQTYDSTLTQILSVVPAAGSFTITGNATADKTTNICWTLEE